MRLGRDLPLLPLVILVPFVLIAVFANVIAPYDPTEPIPGAKIFEPPVWSSGGSMRALLGTDFQSRDVLSRLIFGARVSLIVGVMGTVVAGGIGTTLGMLAGYIGGWVDQLIMRVTDAWLALPASCSRSSSPRWSDRACGTSSSSWAACTGHGMPA